MTNPQPIIRFVALVLLATSVVRAEKPQRKALVNLFDQITIKFENYVEQDLDILFQKITTDWETQLHARQKLYHDIADELIVAHQQTIGISLPFRNFRELSSQWMTELRLFFELVPVGEQKQESLTAFLTRATTDAPEILERWNSFTGDSRMHFDKNTSLSSAWAELESYAHSQFACVQANASRANRQNDNDQYRLGNLCIFGDELTRQVDLANVAFQITEKELPIYRRILANLRDRTDNTSTKYVYFLEEGVLTGVVSFLENIASRLSAFRTLRDKYHLDGLEIQFLKAWAKEKGDQEEANLDYTMDNISFRIKRLYDKYQLFRPFVSLSTILFSHGNDLAFRRERLEPAPDSNQRETDPSGELLYGGPSECFLHAGGFEFRFPLPLRTAATKTKRSDYFFLKGTPRHRQIDNPMYQLESSDRYCHCEKSGKISPYPLKMLFFEATRELGSQVVPDAWEEDIVVNAYEQDSLLFPHSSNHQRIERNTFQYDPAYRPRSLFCSYSGWLAYVGDTLIRKALVKEQ